MKILKIIINGDQWRMYTCAFDEDWAAVASDQTVRQGRRLLRDWWKEIDTLRVFMDVYIDIITVNIHS